MNIKFTKGTLLKWIFLPVVICVRLIVISVEELILNIPVCKIVSFDFICRKLDFKSGTIVAHKVRMNN